MATLSTRSDVSKHSVIKPLPKACKHSAGPQGYVQRLEWLERMSRRYKQEKCNKCGLWAIWRQHGNI